MDTSKITRLEIIWEERELVKYWVSVELSLQDDWKTLKIFYK